MTAAERLRQLAGVSGTAAALLLLIGSGATAGAALADYSQLPSGTAAEHLLVDVVTVNVVEPIGGYRLPGKRKKEIEPPTAEQIQAERIRLGIIEAKEEKQAVLAKAKAAANGTGAKRELNLYASLLKHEIARLEAEYATQKALLKARGERIRSAAITEIARQQIEHEIELARIEEEDISYVLAMLLEL